MLLQYSRSTTAVQESISFHRSCTVLCKVLGTKRGYRGAGLATSTNRHTTLHDVLVRVDRSLFSAQQCCKHKHTQLSLAIPRRATVNQSIDRSTNQQHLLSNALQNSSVSCTIELLDIFIQLSKIIIGCRVIYFTTV